MNDRDLIFFSFSDSDIALSAIELINFNHNVCL